MEKATSAETLSNAAEAYLLESQAIQLYGWYAKIATKEGYHQVAAIFQETAEQKKSHCKTLYRFLENSRIEFSLQLNTGQLATTPENLKTAAAMEKQQAEILFAGFQETAFANNQKQLGTKLKLFRQIKQFYAQRFEKLAANIENGSIFKRDKKVKWICRKCGLIYESERALKNCPGCEHPQAYFEILAENY